MASGEVVVQSMWSPAVTAVRARGIPCYYVPLKEGYRAWASGLGLMKHLSGMKLDAAYDYINWHQSGWQGLLERERAPSLELLDREDERIFDPELELFEDFPRAPLRNDARDEDPRRLLEILNSRFLPHLVGARTPPVEHLLAANGGEYRVRIRHGTIERHRDVDYRISFARLQFHEVETSGDPDEHYWAHDLEDYLDGRCDDFSTFCRHPLVEGEPRFWSCLGLPYLNNDLVEKKVRYHFERARRGESVDEWVLGFYRGLEI